MEDIGNTGHAFGELGFNHQISLRISASDNRERFVERLVLLSDFLGLGPNSPGGGGLSISESHPTTGLQGPSTEDWNLDDRLPQPLALLFAPPTTSERASSDK